MNIGIDIDDTISNTFETFLPYMKKFVEQDLNRELNMINLTILKLSMKKVTFFN